MKVAAARDGARERHSNLIVTIPPVCRNEQCHRQTHFVFSEQARDGRTAGLSFHSRPDGAGLRAFGGCSAARFPRHRLGGTPSQALVTPSSLLPMVLDFFRLRSGSNRKIEGTSIQSAVIEDTL